MKRTMQIISLLVLCAASRAAAETGWKLALTGVSADSTTDWALGGSVGVGLDLEYRASRHLGLGLGVLTSEIENEAGLDFFGFDVLVIESSVRTTPVLARLDVHLTPDHRADLYLGPVVGWMHYGDLEVRFNSTFVGGTPVPIERVGTKDGLAWGAHIGVDVPVGDRGLFFNARATWLRADVELDEAVEEDGDLSLALNPLVAQVGFGYRF